MQPHWSGLSEEEYLEKSLKMLRINPSICLNTFRRSKPNANPIETYLRERKEMALSAIKILN